jgi:hypothetical protein
LYGFYSSLYAILLLAGNYAIFRNSQALHSNDDHQTAFAKYNETFRPYVESVQAGITRGLNWLAPVTEAGIQAAIERFKKQETVQ